MQRWKLKKKNKFIFPLLLCLNVVPQKFGSWIKKLGPDIYICKGWTTLKKSFWSSKKNKKKLWPLSSRGEGTKKKIFCGFPYETSKYRVFVNILAVCQGKMTRIKKKIWENLNGREGQPAYSHPINTSALYIHI